MLFNKVIVLLIFLQINSVNAQGVDPVYFSQFNPVFGRIVNSEAPVASEFTANAKIYIGDTVSIDSLSYSLPTGFTISSATNLSLYRQQHRTAGIA